MATPDNAPTGAASTSPSQSAALFNPRPPAPPSSLLPWAVAAAVVALVALGLILHSRMAPAKGQSEAPAHSRQNDAYAPHLAFDALAMSESTSISGGKSTFIDGNVHNNGDSPVTAIEVQVTFPNDTEMPPQHETLLVTSIRTHEPYVDTEPLSIHPLQAGEVREFRLIFEQISPSWNQQLPIIKVTKVFTSENITDLQRK